MQVTLGQVDTACAALNQWFTQDIGNGTVTAFAFDDEFTETDAHTILRPHGFTVRQSKSVLMSLCHWRRLSMRRQRQSVTEKNQEEIVFRLLNH